VPFKTFTANEILTASDVNTQIMGQMICVFAGTAARGSAIPSPVEGQASYRKDADVIEIFDGSVWRSI